MTTNMTVNFYHFRDFIDIFDDRPACTRCIFNIKNAFTESTKPKLRVISCYSIGTLNTINNYRHLAGIFAFIEEKL